jgi:hypothetical protein
MTNGIFAPTPTTAPTSVLVVSFLTSISVSWLVPRPELVASSFALTKNPIEGPAKIKGLMTWDER